MKRMTGRDDLQKTGKVTVNGNIVLILPLFLVNWNLYNEIIRTLVHFIEMVTSKFT